RNEADAFRPAHCYHPGRAAYRDRIGIDRRGDRAGARRGGAPRAVGTARKRHRDARTPRRPACRGGGLINWVIPGRSEGPDPESSAKDGARIWKLIFLRRTSPPSCPALRERLWPGMTTEMSLERPAGCASRRGRDILSVCKDGVG